MEATNPLCRRKENLMKKIKVCVRVRPYCFNLKSAQCGQHQRTWIIDPERHALTLQVSRTKTSDGKGSKKPFDGDKLYKVDYVQDDTMLPHHDMEKTRESQEQMYNAIGLPCVDHAMAGHNVTIVAYGQTGSGKTYTMTGDGTYAGRGIVPRLANELICRTQSMRENGLQLNIQVSYLEIYKEKIRDLLNFEGEPFDLDYQKDQNLGKMDEVTDDDCLSISSDVESCSSINQQDTTETISVDEEDIQSVKCLGMSAKASSSLLRKNRVYAVKPNKEKTSGQHAQSSTSRMATSLTKKFLRIREHPIAGPFVENLTWKEVRSWLEVERLLKHGTANRTTGETNKNKDSSRSHTLLTIKLTWESLASVSYLNLVDLAGSENLNNTKSLDKERFLESKCINRSLTLLNEVILNLSANSFASFRSSALTWLLRDSLKGTGRTYMVANISPDEQDISESLRTLHYVTKAGNIQRCPSTTETKSKDIEMLKMKDEICFLRDLLATLRTNENNIDFHPIYGPSVDAAVQVDLPWELECEEEIARKHLASNGAFSVTEVPAVASASDLHEDDRNMPVVVNENGTPEALLVGDFFIPGNNIRETNMEDGPEKPSDVMSSDGIFQASGNVTKIPRRLGFHMSKSKLEFILHCVYTFVKRMIAVYLTRRCDLENNIRIRKYDSMAELQSEHEERVPFLVGKFKNEKFITYSNRRPLQVEQRIMERLYDCTGKNGWMIIFLEPGVTQVGSRENAQIRIQGLEDEHLEIIYMPEQCCLNRKGFIAVRGLAFAELNNEPIFQLEYLKTGDELSLKGSESNIYTFYYFRSFESFIHQIKSAGCPSAYMLSS